MAPGVRDIASSLTNDRLEELRILYEIPDDMAMVVPEAHDRALRPSDGFITVYEVHLNGGLRFPVPLELHEIMRDLGVPLARLQPNAIRYLVSLCVFLRCHDKLLNATVVKVMFRFTHNIDWITMTHRRDFSVMCGGNPDSTRRWKDKFFFLGVRENWSIPLLLENMASQYCSDPTRDEREAVREFSDLVMANLGGFHENKRNIWLSSENLAKAKWGPQSEASVMTSSEKSKKKRLRRKGRSLRIRGPTERPEKSCSVESSKRPMTIIEYPSSDDEDEDDDDDDVVIAPLLKRSWFGSLQRTSKAVGPGPASSAAPLGEPCGAIVQIVELSDAQSPDDESTPSVPANFSGEVSDRIGDPS